MLSSIISARRSDTLIKRISSLHRGFVLPQSGAQNGGGGGGWGVMIRREFEKVEESPRGVVKKKKSEKGSGLCLTW